jgi:hypothetical protein
VDFGPFFQLFSILASHRLPDRFISFSTLSSLLYRKYRPLRLRDLLSGTLTDMIFILLIIILIACYFIFCTQEVPQPNRRGGRSRQYSRDNRTPGPRQRRLYCETCYSSADIDSTGWCHRCERTFSQFSP